MEEQLKILMEKLQSGIDKTPELYLYSEIAIRDSEYP